MLDNCKCVGLKNILNTKQYIFINYNKWKTNYGKKSPQMFL